MAADILNAPVAVVATSNIAALGAALMGGYAAGIVSDDDIRGIPEQASQPVSVFEPRQEQAERYNERFEIYRDLYPNLRHTTHRLARLVEQEPNDEAI